MVAALENDCGFHKLSEEEKIQVLHRGMLVASELLLPEWCPDKRSWYVNMDDGIGGLLWTDVKAYYYPS